MSQVFKTIYGMLACRYMALKPAASCNVFGRRVYDHPGTNTASQKVALRNGMAAAE